MNSSTGLLSTLIKSNSCDIISSFSNNTLVDNFLNNSKCTTTQLEKKYLASILGNNSTILLYNASADGWTSDDFHSRCDNKGPTISLFKVSNGDCIGGYTSTPWVLFSKMPLSAKEAILFNLSKCRYFVQQRINSMSMMPSMSNGPCFGAGEGNELCAKSPFNAEGNCESFVNRQGFFIPILNSKLNMLTYRYDGNFTITELEVWGI